MKSIAALILVDIQNDFCPGGSLAVPEGDAIVPLANKLQAHFSLVVATQDWHPADHMSFATNHPEANVGDVKSVHGQDQILWPDHCVQETQGAELHPELKTDNVQKILYKGTDKTIDSYSAFFDNAHLRTTGLAEYLREQGIQEVYIMGLATEYCVKYSCMDAVRLGFRTHVIIDACRGIDLQPGDIQRAIEEMESEDVQVMQMSEVLERFAVK